MGEPSVALTGAGEQPIWHMTSAERICRMAAQAGLRFADGDADIKVDAGFVFDPLWLDHVAQDPGLTVTCDGHAVLAHHGELSHALASEGATLFNPALRKREQPFMMVLTPASRDAAERASYDAAYKGVTDFATKYLWHGLAFYLVRIAARIGVSPNNITAIGAVLCVLATTFFYRGDYWPGMAAGFIFMVLDTVDGKLARCTLTSSKIGDFFDHGIDLVHPPFWWWAWGMGLMAYGTPLAEAMWTFAFAAILASYVLQRVIEGIFIAAFRIHIHVWRKLDSDFRLITARRNPNMLLLIPFLLLQRPDWGFLALAIWGVASLLFHLVRLIQAFVYRVRGQAIESWLGQASSA